MSWEKLQPLSEGQGNGCCTFHGVIAPLDMVISVGFGMAVVMKDGETVYDERNYDYFNEIWTMQRAEEEAIKDPDHDWRVIMHAPKYGLTYQRHDVDKWILVDKNIGFA